MKHEASKGAIKASDGGTEETNSVTGASKSVTDVVTCRKSVTAFWLHAKKRDSSVTAPLTNL